MWSIVDDDRHWSANYANSAFHPSGVGKWAVIHITYMNYGGWLTFWTALYLLGDTCLTYPTYERLPGGNWPSKLRRDGHWRNVSVIVDVGAQLTSSMSDRTASQLRPSLSVTLTWYVASRPQDFICSVDVAVQRRQNATVFNSSTVLTIAVTASSIRWNRFFACATVITSTIQYYNIRLLTLDRTQAISSSSSSSS